MYKILRFQLPNYMTNQIYRKEKGWKQIKTRKSKINQQSLSTLR